MKTHKKLIITFHNPNNENDSQLIAEDFISHASQKVVKDYVLNQKTFRSIDGNRRQAYADTDELK